MLLMNNGKILNLGQNMSTEYNILGKKNKPLIFTLKYQNIGNNNNILLNKKNLYQHRFSVVAYSILTSEA